MKARTGEKSVMEKVYSAGDYPIYPIHFFGLTKMTICIFSLGKMTWRTGRNR